MVSDMYHNIVPGQKGNDGQLSVGDVHTSTADKRLLIVPQTPARSVT